MDRAIIHWITTDDLPVVLAAALSKKQVDTQSELGDSQDDPARSGTGAQAVMGCLGFG